MNQPNPGSTENTNDQVAADAVAAAMAEDTGSPLANTAELQAKIDDLQNRLLRSQAELENFRRRTYREQEECSQVRIAATGSRHSARDGWTESRHRVGRTNR